ncbi:MAG TPA: nucleotide exchange factor GrpE [Myxococcales bacterium]|jgi:molecular chaperone GrpE
MAPDDTQIPPDAAAQEERGVLDDGGAPVPLPGGGDPAALQRKVALLESQLEESFKRARDTGDRLKETHERLLRSAAEFDNFKKRALKEKEDAQKFGNERLLKDFLPVMDNLERALEHAGEQNLAQVLEGVKLVQKLFETTLAKHGVVGFSAVGKPFDPTVHEALMQQESDQPSGTVLSEMAKGYKLHERLVRPSAVVVSKGRESEKAAGDGSQGGGQTPSA